MICMNDMIRLYIQLVKTVTFHRLRNKIVIFIRTNITHRSEATANPKFVRSTKVERKRFHVESQKVFRLRKRLRMKTSKSFYTTESSGCPCKNHERC